MRTGKEDIFMEKRGDSTDEAFLFQLSEIFCDSSIYAFFPLVNLNLNS
jgi:hypothetical protein